MTTMSRASARRARSRSRNRLDRLTLAVLIAFIVMACITAGLAFAWVRSSVSAWGDGANQPVAGVSSRATEDANSENVTIPTGPLQHGAGPTAVPWDGRSRITILVMGLDSRAWEEDDVPRTDSMIVVSVDPETKTAGMLSIPRDVWIDIPGMGYNKINTAYRWGEVYQVPGGGPGLAMTSVEQLIGLPVNYYAMIDFNAFVAFIDEMGGLDMHIREEIVVDPIGPGNTRTLEPGVQTLDGATVLAYARQRYTANDDFDRSERQQEVIMAIRQQILQFDMLPVLIKKAPKLYSQLSSGISTNLTLENITRLALLAADINEKNIKRAVVSPPLQVEISTNPADGQSILVPNPEQIRILRDQVFASSSQVVVPTRIRATETPAKATPTPPDLEKLVKSEKARVAVKNGTATEGLASKTGELLKSWGINVVEEGNADEPAGSTTIIDYTGKQGTLRFLAEKMKIPESRVIYRNDPNAEIDIEVILGTDWAEQQ